MIPAQRSRKLPRRRPDRNWPQYAADVFERQKEAFENGSWRGLHHETVLIFLGRSDKTRTWYSAVGAGRMLVVPKDARAREFDWPYIHVSALPGAQNVCVWCARGNNLATVQAFCQELSEIAYDRVFLYGDHPKLRRVPMQYPVR